MGSYSRIGIIAGGGDLPHSVIAGAIEGGAQVFIAALEGFSAPEDFGDMDAQPFRLGEVGRLIKTLKSKNLEAICFAGIVARPDFSALRPDLGGVKYLPGAIKAATKGDDGLLRYVASIFDKEGIKVIGPQQLCEGILAPLGPLGAHDIPDAMMSDAIKARETAKAIGALDIGQGAIVCKGLILAVEAQEGTDAMLSRAAGLPGALIGDSEARAGVLAKMVKPGQEDRLDLPTIGVGTIIGAAYAGLAGIVLEQGRAFILDREGVIAAADAQGLFVVGLEASS
ncbi:MAG: UDP-2,3-diacylglucosamine diphosphatase LpxI [Robiginitomaculum sp.]